MYDKLKSELNDKNTTTERRVGIGMDGRIEMIPNTFNKEKVA